jgi:flagellar biosynthesis protein FlhF
MRIRTFTAHTTPAAIALVREEMGPDAVIISIDQTANGCGTLVRAAVDGDPTDLAAPTCSLPALSAEARLEALLRERLRPAFRSAHKSAA